MAKKPKYPCVACGKTLAEAGKTWRCSCGGAWVPESWLVDMAEQQKGKFAKLPWEPRTGTSRPCPVCAAAMTTLTLGGIELDRCDTHGVWFDPTELPAVLAAAKKFPVETPAAPRPIAVFAPHVRQEDTNKPSLLPASDSAAGEVWRRTDVVGLIGKLFG